MQILALFLASLMGLGLTLFLKATVDCYYRRQKQNDYLEIKMTAVGGLWKFKFRMPTAQLEWEEGPELEMQQESQAAMGEKRRTRMDVRFRYFQWEFFYTILPWIPQILHHFKSVKQKFYRGIHCTFLDWRVDIGVEDPAYTAVLTGSFWSMLGFFLARLYRQVTMDTERPYIFVSPNFKKPGFSCEIHCVFNLRLGHLMVVALDLIRLFIRTHTALRVDRSQTSENIS